MDKNSKGRNSVSNMCRRLERKSLLLKCSPPKKHRLLLGLFCLFIFPIVFASNGLTLFDTERTAQDHCPQDEVVWLNLPTGIWHPKNGHWYGTTKHGAYVCKQEASTAGNRASRNGQ